jgi:cell division protein FtsL
MSKRTSPSAAEKAEAQTYRKPRADIYTLLLSLAMIALIVASTMLWLTMSEYNKEIKLTDTERPSIASGILDKEQGRAR